MPRAPADFKAHAKTLFGKMNLGGVVVFEKVEWFNGGLVNDDTTLALEADDVAELHAATALDWSDIHLFVLGTLLERGLDPE